MGNDHQGFGQLAGRLGMDADVVGDRMPNRNARPSAPNDPAKLEDARKANELAEQIRLKAKEDAKRKTGKGGQSTIETDAVMSATDPQIEEAIKSLLVDIDITMGKAPATVKQCEDSLDLGKTFKSALKILKSRKEIRLLDKRFKS